MFFDRGQGSGVNSDGDLSYEGGGAGPYHAQDWDDRISSNLYISYC
ncbi:hypothetical protein CCO02nite_27040 [Cellulomonas composti]|uniref:Uncharacterized protein n=1 Tax=Cellulomonas composti TaxID=266130 RepID=A0A511JDM7_9CELL|nr:hypothetical protein CCO02nite_27040 [Cellulomonas composti]